MNKVGEKIDIGQEPKRYCDPNDIHKMIASTGFIAGS
jgi:hypothetical protein